LNLLGKQPQPEGLVTADEFKVVSVEGKKVGADSPGA
jgi:hypothetical protein